MKDSSPWKEVHQKALKDKKVAYVDPDTRAVVLTEWGHMERGHCCGCGCRHCPWADQLKNNVHFKRGQKP